MFNDARYRLSMLCVNISQCHAQLKEPELPVDESSRIAALNSLGIVYSPVEERFDRITRIAKRMFDVPIALISLVAADQQWFKSCQGLTVAETPCEFRPSAPIMS